MRSYRLAPGPIRRFLGERLFRASTKNQDIAVLRCYFDTLVARQAMILNPLRQSKGTQAYFVLNKQKPPEFLTQESLSPTQDLAARQG